MVWPTTQRLGFWRCNVLLLKDVVSRETIGTFLRDYFLNNENSEILKGLLFEAAMATVRGELISMGSRRKRLSLAEEKKLTKVIMDRKTTVDCF